MCVYDHRTGKVPKASAGTPEDFIRVFDEIHSLYPDKLILHLAYSAVTTCSYQSALPAGEGRDYVKSFDTRHVSVGQAAVVLRVAEALKANPHWTFEEALPYCEEVSRNTHMCFIPNDLDYLRHLHPASWGIRCKRLPP